MPNAPRVLAFSGSIRRESFNTKLLRIAVEETRAAGAEVTHIDLKDYPIPLFNADLEEESGLPDTVRKLVDLLKAHHAILVASPEYNSLITPLLKNTLDWCSRAENDPFEGKVAAVISASPGALGGVRSALVARNLLMKLGCYVIPSECTLSRAQEAFDDSGRLKNPKSLEAAKALAADLVSTTAKLIA